MLIFAGCIFTLLIFTVLGVWTYMEFWRLVDISSLLIIILPLMYFLWVSQSGKIINRYILSSFKKGNKYSTTELESIIIATKNIIKFILALGLFVFVFGLSSMLSHLYFYEDGWLQPLMSSIRANLLVLIYSIAIILFVFFPVKAWAENKIRASEETNLLGSQDPYLQTSQTALPLARRGYSAGSGKLCRSCRDGHILFVP